MNNEKFLNISEISMQEFKTQVREAMVKFVNGSLPNILANDFLRGCPEFDPENNLAPFYKKWFLIVPDLPNYIAVRISSKMCWIIAGDEVIIYTEE